MSTIQSVSVIGHGNVGDHLARQLFRSGINVRYILGHSSLESTQELASAVNAEASLRFSDLPQDELVILCVPDTKIEKVLKELPSSTPVAYTSGSIHFNKLPHRENLGVFYPLQTFTKGKDVNFQEVPMFIEASNEAFGKSLFELGTKISSTVSYANSEERQKLHLTAVWVNNFTNHILYHAKLYADKNDVNFEHLLPLLNETIEKLKNNSPEEAQTGPARRGDLIVIQKHLQELEGNSKEIYKLLSESILNIYQND